MTKNTNDTEKLLNAAFGNIDKNFLNILSITRNDTSRKLFANIVSSTMPSISDEEFEQSIQPFSSIAGKNKEVANMVITSIKELREIHAKFPISAGYTSILLEGVIAATMVDNNYMQNS